MLPRYRAIPFATVAALAAGLAAAAPIPDPNIPPADLQRALTRAKPIDEAYRRQFETCDRTDHFGAVQLPTRQGKRIWYGCRSDPSRLTRLVMIPQVNETREAIVFDAKIAHDLDGSPKACSRPGKTDQCRTGLMLNPTARHPCPAATRKKGGRCWPIDADSVAYVAIPADAPPGIKKREFATRTGLQLGDYGVVFANDRAVPVIIADIGPAYKIGEGSTALLRQLSVDGRPHALSGGVTYVLFPDSGDRALSPDDLASTVRKKGIEFYQRIDSQGE